MTAIGNDRELPEGFEDLEQFVEVWALAEEQQRMQRRWSSSMEQIQHFYDAMAPQVERALNFLDGRDIEALSPSESRLLYLTYSLVEVANPVEVYHRPASSHALPPDRFAPVDPL